MEKSAVKKLSLALMLSLVAAAVLAFAYGRQSTQSLPGAEKSLRRVVLALPVQLSNAAWFAGIENGDFRASGIELINQRHAIGLHALEALMQDRADLALVADTPIMFEVMRGGDVTIVATTYSSRDYMALIARSDSGVIKPSDLKGKKIGYVAKTSGHFFLYSFLLANGLGNGRTTTIPIQLAEAEDMISSGQIDALVTWEPYLSQIKQALEGASVEFYGPELYSTRFSLVARSQYAKSHQAEIKALIQGLAVANRFVKEESEQARVITAKYMNVDATLAVPALLAGEYKATLEQAQLLSLEDQARWALKEKLVPAQPVPNFLRHMDAAALTTVAPDAVTLVR